MQASLRDAVAAAIAFTKRIEIRWRDMDAFKHVNNAVYLTYLEEMRDEWFLEVLGNGLLLNDFVLARCAVDYRSPVTQEDGHVDVELRCTRVGRSSVTTAERITVPATAAASPPRPRPCSCTTTGRPASRAR